MLETTQETIQKHQSKRLVLHQLAVHRHRQAPQILHVHQAVREAQIAPETRQEAQVEVLTEVQFEVHQLDRN